MDTQRRALNNIFKFLALMLVFTLIVRGTSGAAMARVTLTSPGRSVIADEVSGSATVFAVDNIEITAPMGLTVSEMLVGVGREVQEGDEIAVFLMDELSEMYIRELASLDRMLLDLENLTHNDTIDTTAINNAQRSLERAREDYESVVLLGEENIADARERLDSLLRDDFESAAVRNLRRALDDYEAAERRGRENVEEAQQELFDILASPPEEADDTALQNAIRNHQRESEDFNAIEEQGKADIAEAEADLRELRSRRPADIDRTALDNAELREQRARENYEAAQQRNSANLNTAQTALQNANRVLTEAEEEPHNTARLAEARRDAAAAQSAFAAAQKTMDDFSISPEARALEDAVSDLEQARKNFNEGQEKEIENAENALEILRERVEGNLRTAGRRLEDAEISLRNARRNFDESREREIELAEKALEAAKTAAADSLLSAARRLEDSTQSAGDEIEQARTALQNAITQAGNSRQSAARQVEDAINSLNTAQQNHRNNLRQHGNTMAQNDIAVRTLQLDISTKRELIETLDEIIKNEGVLYSNAAGVVLAVQPTGSILTARAAVTLRVLEGGFEARMTVPRNQAENLSVGDNTEVRTSGGSMFRNPSVTGVISSISQADENDNVTVAIALPQGNWSAGQRVESQIVLSSGNYDLSLPVAAIRSDNEGYFVYVIAHRNTVLGLQNEVVRVDVNITARDKETASVTGAVANNSEVIVSSNRSINVGDRVRVG
jgi:multidrug efflux pump subunit AcrA (membrane-fusion protein)